VVASGEDCHATTSVQVRAESLAELVLAAVPRQRVLAPGARTEVDVLVRTRDGAPVRNATIAWEPHAEPHELRELRATTDADGRASIALVARSTSGPPFSDEAWVLSAVHPALGTTRAPVSARVSRQSFFATWAVEGGALVPGLPGRVFVRLVDAEGAPLTGRALTLVAPRLGGGLTARTDGDGVAVFSGALSAETAPDDGGERCGGATAADAQLIYEGEGEGLCLAVDADATVVVRASPGGTPHALRLELDRRPEVARAPMVIDALARRGEAWEPVSRRLVTAADAARVELTLPDDVRGEVWVRVRPVVDGREVRGGGTVAWVGSVPSRLALAAREDGARVSGLDDADTLAVLAVDEARAEALLVATRAAMGPVAAAVDAGGGEGLRAFLLASRAPVDAVVSAVLRTGEIATLPLPSEPAGEGLLRDPWRTRARFVRGRIGRLMRAVESYVDEHVSGEQDSLDDVATREGARHAFNEDLLDGVLASADLGEEGVTSLDGEPLDIAGLRAMDPAFTYDNVARRITRARLWTLLRFLRELVHQRELDLDWARRGEPSQLLLAMLEDGDMAWESAAPERRHLLDAWGTPFVLRPVRGRPRFAFLQPVSGYELVSAGPDARHGTADDLVDPFARALPSGSLYAEAVGEDELLAQLQGVALGRATVDSLGELFDAAPQLPSDDEVERTPAPELPGRLERATIGPVPVAPALESIGDVGSAASRAWTLPRERRRYAVLALRFTDSGLASSARAELTAGAPYAVGVELPSWIRPDERLSIPLAIVPLAEAAAPTVSVSSSSEALEARVLDGRLELRARRAGLARLTLRVTVDGREVWSHEASIRVLPPGQLRGRHASGFVRERASFVADTPRGTSPVAARLVVVGPRTLDRDPALAAARAAHPAIFAWAQAIRGEPIEPELLARITRDRARGSTPIETACGLPALTGEAQRHVLAASARALERELGTDLASRAAVLAALASSAPATVAGPTDSVSGLVTGLREDGWRALASTTDQPAVMARVAAALLLVDREDSRGIALLDRAAAAYASDDEGHRDALGSSERAADEWIGTLALAVAARQVGRDALADEAAHAAAERLVLTSRAGADALFWAVAASVYGVFGVEMPSEVAITLDGTARTLPLSGGVGELAIGPDSTVEVRSRVPVLARVESRFVGDRGGQSSPLRARIEGDGGRRGGRSGLELVLEGPESGAPVVEIALPGGAAVDSEALAAMRRSAAVRSVGAPDAAGIVRIHLSRLAAGAEHRVPLPWRWIASGDASGLELTAYDASSPERASTTAGRMLVVEESR
jgi:hypothetical protein